MKSLFFALCLTFVLSLVSAVASAGEVRLSGHIEEDGSVRLLWEVPEWADDLRGFYLKRRPADGGGWSELHSDPIMPGYVYDRDWAALGVTESRRSGVFEVLDRITNRGERTLDYESSIERLRMAGGVPSGTLIAMGRDFNQALALGFGFIDRAANQPEDHEYGLFALLEGGKVGSEPVATYSFSRQSRVADEVVTALEVEPFGRRLMIRWKSTKDLVTAADVSGFNVYVKEAGSDDFEAITPSSYWRSPGSDGVMEMEWPHDPGLSSEAPIELIYAVEPVTSFGKVLPKKEVRHWLMPNVQRPRGLRVRRQEDGLYQISWQVPKENLRFDWLEVDIERVFIDDMSQLSEQELLGGTVTSIPYEIVASGLPMETTTWVDPTQTETALEANYRVVFRDKQGRDFVASSGRPATLRPNVKPSPIKGLRATVLPKSRSGFSVNVRLEWEGSAEMNPLIDHLTVSSGDSPSQLVKHSSYQIKEDSFELSVAGDGKPKYFKLTPISPDGLEGESRLIEVSVPNLRLPPFPKNDAVVVEHAINRLETRIRWRYEGRSDIRGFRIRDLKNGKILADIDELGADAEEWVWRGQELLEVKRPDLGIVAVGAFDHVESREERVVISNPHVRRNYALPPWEVKSVKVLKDAAKQERNLVVEWVPWEEQKFSEIKLLGIGPVGPDPSKISCYPISWSNYLETENGKLVVKLPDHLSGEIRMRLIPLYPNESGAAVISGRFAEFSVDVGAAIQRKIAEPAPPQGSPTMKPDTYTESADSYMSGVLPGREHIEYVIGAEYVRQTAATDPKGDMYKRHRFSEMDIIGMSLSRKPNRTIRVQIEFAEPIPEEPRFDYPYRIWVKCDFDNDPKTGNQRTGGLGEDISFRLDGPDASKGWAYKKISKSDFGRTVTIDVKEIEYANKTLSFLLSCDQFADEKVIGFHVSACSNGVNFVDRCPANGETLPFAFTAEPFKPLLK